MTWGPPPTDRNPSGGSLPWSELDYLVSGSGQALLLTRSECNAAEFYLHCCYSSLFFHRYI